MKILITGATGFIGNRLVQEVCSIYGKNNVLALSSRNNDFCETIVYSGIDFSINQADLEKLEQVNVLIHAGAYTPKNGREINAIGACNGNINFTEKLLNLPLDNIKKIIYLSTVDVYEASKIISESTPTLPQSLYGMSKLYSEKMIEIHSKKNDIECQILRLGHVYGPGEEVYEKFLPKAIFNIVNNKPVDLWGDGNELRSFIYIDDVISATMMAINLSMTFGVINVVGGKIISICHLLNTLIEISGKQVRIIKNISNSTSRDYIFDNTKLKNTLLPKEFDFLAGLKKEYFHVESLN
jgi:UDP-glucose 4-epimerase